MTPYATTPRFRALLAHLSHRGPPRGMDHDHELAEEWHRKDVPPETVLLISLGALLGLGVCTQVVRQSTLPVVITLILMAVITLGSMVALQSSLPASTSHGRPAYQSP